MEPARMACFEHQLVVNKTSRRVQVQNQINLVSCDWCNLIIRFPGVRDLKHRVSGIFPFANTARHPSGRPTGHQPLSQCRNMQHQ